MFVKHGDLQPIKTVYESEENKNKVTQEKLNKLKQETDKQEQNNKK